MTSETPRAGAVAGPGVAPFDLLPHNCFACGTLNRHGLQLLLHVEPGRAWTKLAVARRFEGWADMTHGGIVCTILDEVMAWSLVGEDNWGVTARLAVAFKRPVAIGTLIRADGQIASKRRRVVEATARIVDVANALVLATATGTYLAADGARKRELRDRYGFRLKDDAQADMPGAVDRTEIGTAAPPAGVAR